MKQRTLKREYRFEGKGLHTGVFSRMTVGPSDPGTGIVFLRTDLGECAAVDALASNVRDTSRSTNLSSGSSSVGTVEHLLSALTGLGVDNALIRIDAPELPILDGSAKPYADAIAADGLQVQEAERKMIILPRPIEVKDEKSGGYVRISPVEQPSYSSTIDFDSRVLGVQNAVWDPSIDYSSQIAPCRTFVFLHELSFLFSKGLVKGGDVDNAIVVVEHPVPESELDKLRALFGKEKISVGNNGYLDNLTLRFDNECGRHKLLDLIGDLRLCGGFLQAKVEAYKPGHSLNTRAAAAVLEATKKI